MQRLGDVERVAPADADVVEDDPLPAAGARRGRRLGRFTPSASAVCFESITPLAPVSRNAWTLIVFSFPFPVARAGPSGWRRRCRLTRG